MTFTEMVNAVLTIVKRPDKTVEAGLAVNAAISFFTLRTKFARDMVEATISVDPTLYGDTIDLSASTTRFREFQFVKITGKRGYLNKIGPDKIFVPGGQMQKNCYYLTGLNMTYILSELTSSLDVGYYQYAPTLTGTDTHWLSDMIPQAVIDHASARLFKDIGDDNSAQQKEGSAKVLYDTLVNDLALQNY